LHLLLFACMPLSQSLQMLYNPKTAREDCASKKPVFYFYFF